MGRRYFYNNCEVVNIVDGDTLDVSIRWDIGFRVVTELPVRLRVARINCPETNRRDQAVEGRAAERFLRSLVRERVTREVEGDEAVVMRGSIIGIESLGPDGLDRWVADIWIDPRQMGDNHTLSEVMVGAGHAVYQTYGSMVGAPRADTPFSIDPADLSVLRRFNGWV